MSTTEVSATAVTLEGVHVALQQQTILENIQLHCRPGEFVAVVGPSGCGKSTLLRVVARLLAPQSGRVAYDPSTANECGFVFQQPNLLAWRNVIDNIALPLELAGSDRSARRSMAREARALMGLTDDDESKLPAMLSGGMQMRVSLARALVASPQLMLLDEPFAALDDLLRYRLNEELSRIWQAQRWTGIFVTHNLHEAVYLSQRVIVLAGTPGRIVGACPIEFDFPRPAKIRTDPRFSAYVDAVMQMLWEPGA